MNNSTKKYKCSYCKKLKRKWQFPQRQKQINTKRGHVDYICNNCHNDMQIIKIARKKGLPYLKEKAQRYAELAALYNKEIQKIEGKSNLSKKLKGGQSSG